MAITDSEKLVTDTVRALEKNGDIVDGDRLDAYSGAGYQSSCKMDAFMVRHDGYTIWIEVKESGQKRMAMSQYKDDQMDILKNGVMDHSAYITIIRLFTDDIHKNSQEWFQRYAVVNGANLENSGTWNPIDLEEKGIIVAETRFRETEGIEKCGVTTRGNKCDGLVDLLNACNKIIKKNNG